MSKICFYILCSSYFKTGKIKLFGFCENTCLQIWNAPYDGSCQLVLVSGTKMINLQLLFPSGYIFILQHYLSIPGGRATVAAYKPGL